MNAKRLPSIVWTAARPPITPFSGPASKALRGASALPAMTRVEVISFVPSDRLLILDGIVRAAVAVYERVFHPRCSS